MKSLATRFGGAIAAATLMFAMPASAQLEIYTDYAPSDGVVEMTLVKVDEGQFDFYLEGLKDTWVAANDVAKELGHIEDYAIYGVPYGENDFNMVLVITYPSTELIGPSKARYTEFLEAWGKTELDESNATVRELYNKIRTIQGTYMLRQIEMIGE